MLRDFAEDGRLEGSPIAQGSVDSTLSFSVNVKPEGEETIYYWIAAGKDYPEVSRLNKMIMGHGTEYFIRRTGNYWGSMVKQRENLFLKSSYKDCRAVEEEPPYIKDEH